MRLRARVTGYDVSDKDIVHLDVLLSGQTLLWQKFQPRLKLQKLWLKPQQLKM